MTWYWWTAVYFAVGLLCTLILAYAEGRNDDYNWTGKHPGYAISTTVCWPLIALAVVWTPLDRAFHWAYDLGLKHREKRNGL